MELNLKTKNLAEEKIKKYLEENVSEELAEKINNGVKIQKDGQTLLNRKDLTNFLKFASLEAKKQADINANFACIDDAVVFGWAVHYFEEDKIIGELYNEDGTKYQSPLLKPSTPKVEAKKIENKQPTLFDLISENNQKNNSKNKNVEKFTENVEKIAKNVQKIEKIKEKSENNSNLIISHNRIVDKETGEIIKNLDYESSINKKAMYKLYSLLEGKIEIQ